MGAFALTLREFVRDEHSSYGRFRQRMVLAQLLVADRDGSLEERLCLECYCLAITALAVIFHAPRKTHYLQGKAEKTITLIMRGYSLMEAIIVQSKCSLNSLR